ncbi:MAG: TonB family protein [Tannerella sp.]|jgi:protein TonB|nr:TonB family protein [Tannerella sp.]
MGKDINLYSQSWNDIIFEDKNKAYGAYELRQTSDSRHSIALMGSLLIAAFIAALSLTVRKEPGTVARGTITDDVVIAHLTEMEKQKELDDIVEQIEPLPLLKNTVQFIEPEIVSADEIAESETLKSQDELQASKVQISTQTVENGDDVLGVDIAELQRQQVVADESAREPLTVVEQNPEFPGGYAAMMKWLGENLNYPVVAQESNIKGRVTLKFVVNTDGSVDRVQVLKGVDPSLDREAVRAVQAMPKWIPGKQNGKTVNVWFTLPVDFRLQQ